MTQQEVKSLDGLAAKVDILLELVHELRQKMDEMPEKYATKAEVGWPKSFTYVVGILTAGLTWLATKAFSGK